ncbi:MAG TPA: hypothetical protein VF548_17665 [Allosphingosinicella sp.]|jgi:hypothetical protein
MKRIKERNSFALATMLTLASFGLFAPSAASASGGYYPDLRCEQRMRNFCAANWQAEGWSSYQECSDYEIFWTCYDGGNYPGYPRLTAPAGGRERQAW